MKRILRLDRSRKRRSRRRTLRRRLFESLEPRLPLAADFGDAPAPYPVTLAEVGARHDVIVAGPQLGANVDMEADGVHSAAGLANADDLAGVPDDEDGVTFGSVIRVGQQDATVTVNVQTTVGKLDAWIDFNGDGSWGGPGEQIFASRDVVAGDNSLTFDVPSDAIAGDTVARFRLSTAGGLGVRGAAADGEVEDHVVTIDNPGSGGTFQPQSVITTNADIALSVFAADVDGDGDLDVLSASSSDDKIAWYENVEATQNVNLSVSSTAGSEAAGTQITVTATADAAVSGNHTVDLAVTGTDITAGDFTLSAATITIADGMTTGSVTFTVEDDSLAEALTETATLTISNPSAGLTLGPTTSANIAITDNDFLTPVIATTAPSPNNLAAVPITVDFGQTVTGFVAGDVTIGGTGTASISGFSDDGGGLFSFDVNPTADGTITLNVAAAAADDAGGKDTLAATELSFSSDRTAPGVAISSNTAGAAGGDFTLTFTFTESVTGFDAGDLLLSGGTEGAFAGSGTTYTLVVTPPANSTTPITADVAANVAADGVGNGNTAAGQFSQEVDTTVPPVLSGVQVTQATTDEGQSVTLSGTVTDSDAGVVVATLQVDWGDGTIETVAVGSGAFSLDHRYADDPADGLNQYTINVAVADDGPSQLGIPKHRYAFNDLTGDADGTTLTDTGYDGTGHGEVQKLASDTVSEVAGGRLVLRGGDDLDSGYGDLPNGILTGAAASGVAGSVTIESWVTVDAVQNWARIFSFGSKTTGESTGPDNQGVGHDALFVSTAIGNDVNAQRVQFQNNDPLPDASAGGNVGENLADATTLGGEFYVAVVFDEDAGELRYYREIAGTVTLRSTLDVSALPLSELNDVNNWLGRSQWSPDDNLAGRFDEFRIHDAALLEVELAANFAAGADDDFAIVADDSTSLTVTVNNLNPTADADSVTVDAGASVVIDVLGRDSDVAGAAGGDFTVTFSFSESVTGFIADDVVISGGTKGLFAGSGDTYTLVVTPPSNSTTPITVDVAANVAIDASGNANTAAGQFTQQIDTVAPMPVITGPPSPTALGPFDVSIDFGELVVGFAQTDIAVGNGNVTSLVDNGGGAFTATIAPASEGFVTVDVAASVAQDEAGNENQPAETFSVSILSSNPISSPITIEVQDGQSQRSFVRFVEILFDGNDGLQTLIDNDRVRVQRFAIDDVATANPSIVTPSSMTAESSRIRMDFGTDGIGGARQSGDGFYRIGIDVSGNGQFDDGVFEFFRLYGDANGDGVVARADMSTRADLDGNGRFDARDRRVARSQQGRVVEVEFTVANGGLGDGNALPSSSSGAPIAQTNLWTNPVVAADVNDDKSVTALDALIVINELSRGDVSEVPEWSPVELGMGYLDVSGDGRITAIDALQVINRISRADSGEGESASAAEPLLAIESQDRQIKNIDEAMKEDEWFLPNDNLL